MEQTTIKPKEAAKLLGISPLSLYEWLQSGDCPFGYAYRKKGKATRSVYVISKAKLYNFLEIAL